MLIAAWIFTAIALNALVLSGYSAYRLWKCSLYNDDLFQYIEIFTWIIAYASAPTAALFFALHTGTGTLATIGAAILGFLAMKILFAAIHLVVDRQVDHHLESRP